MMQLRLWLCRLIDWLIALSLHLCFTLHISTSWFTPAYYRCLLRLMNRPPELGFCPRCERVCLLHRVKAKDELGVYSMEICDRCDDR